MHTCEYCKTEFSQKSSLNRHQTTVKSCIAIQKQKNVKIEVRLVKCEYCQKELSSNTKLKYHLSICKIKNNDTIELTNQVKKLTDEVILLKEKPSLLDNKQEIKEQYEKELNLLLEIKEHKIKIEHLTKKYVKKQPRTQYIEKNVIYILTTPSHKKEGKYILGIANNLTNRLSTYNKTDEHEVIYYQECPDEDTMAMVEQVVFQRLKDYREQANRERFILPYGESINKFIDVIKKSIEFLK